MIAVDFDCNSVMIKETTTMSAVGPEANQPYVPQITFAQVLQAVDAAEGLTDGVRSNLRSAAERCAILCSNAGLHAIVCVQSIAKMLEKQTAAKLGWESASSLSAFQSNLRRALRLAGITVMPGRHRVPLKGDWRELKERAISVDKFLWAAVSRFVHYLSDKGIEHQNVNAEAFARFQEDVRQTCLKSKADQVLRNTARAWQRAAEFVTGWPKADLGYSVRRADTPLLAWSEFPASLEEDARLYVARGQDDWLAEDAGMPLKPRTQQNYLDGLRRIASILVASGADPAELKTLADLATPTNSETVIRRVSDRTKRRIGGHAEQLALLLFIIARDHVGMSGKSVERMESLWRKTHPKEQKMSDRTLARFRQFENSDRLDALAQLPEELMKLADKRPAPDVHGAKLARVALFVALLFETCARQGNIVQIDLDRHILVDGAGKDMKVFVLVPGHEVKNGEEVRARLSPETARLYRRYIDTYRPIHCAKPTAWLFPRMDGRHWAGTQACADFKDIVARHIGADATPHLVRSLAGMMVLEEHPGAVAFVQQLLGHKKLETTLRSYIHLDKAKIREDYQQILAGHRRR